MLLAACGQGPAAPSASRVCTLTPDANAVVDWCTRWRSVGYELHVTRSPDWSAAASKPIPQAEWETFARSEPRLVEDGYVDWSDSGRAIAFDWKDLAGPSFVWRAGQVNVKGIRTAVELGEIVAFARGLAANIQGDDGEVYGDDGRPK